MQTVAIAGVGLIGASFGLALRREGFSGPILGVSSPDAISAARQIGAISDAVSLEEACSRADVIYLSQTVDRIAETLKAMGPFVTHETLVTDAGSTKVTICAAAAQHLPDRCFVGGHPLAGKETRGAQSADAGLFRGHVYILTGMQGRTSPHFATFNDYLEKFGARVVQLTPQQHDQALAFTSHLPQIVSTALAAALSGQSNPHLRSLFGPGLIDMTRLALSPSDIWSGILNDNREFVLQAIDRFCDQMKITRREIASGTVEGIFESAREFALEVRKNAR
jgi:prephenate dehydrogenase